MSDVASAVLNRMSSGDDGWLIGTVTAIDSVTNSLTVAFPAGSVSGLRWITSYSPAVNDVVAAARISGAWFVIGKNSAVMTASTVRNWSLSAQLKEGSKQGSDPWSWMLNIASQGYWSYADVKYGSYALGSLASVIPSGATVQSAKVKILRMPKLGAAPGSDGPDLVSPVLYGTATGSTSGAPSLASGYGPWRPGKLAFGQQGTWDLPSTWLTALLSGALVGLALYSTSSTDLAGWQSVTFSGTYTY